MTLGSGTVSNLSDFYKVRFPKGIAWRNLQKSPLYNAIQKEQDFSEKSKTTTIQLTTGQGTSPDFATALANRGPGTTLTFTVSLKKLYTVKSLDHQVLTSKDKAQIVKALTRELQLGGDDHGNAVQRWLVGENDGALGQVAASQSTFTSTTLTVRTVNQARNFFKGMVCELATATTSGKLTGTLTVSSVNYATKVITFEETINVAVPSVTTNVYIFRAGEHGNCISGILSWCPTTEPTVGDSFLGANRYTCGDIQRASGFRPSVSKNDHAANISFGYAEAGPFNVDPPNVYVNPMDFDAFLQEQGAKVVYNDPKGDVTANLPGVRVATPTGMKTLYAEPRMPQGTWIGLDPELWTILSQGPIPQMPDQNSFVTESTASAKQIRIISYLCLDCDDPGAQIVGTF